MFSAEVLGRCLQLPLQQMNLHNIKLQQTQVFVLIKENTLQTAAERNEPSPPINTPPQPYSYNRDVFSSFNEGHSYNRIHLVHVSSL